MNQAAQTSIYDVLLVASPLILIALASIVFFLVIRNQEKSRKKALRKKAAEKTMRVEDIRFDVLGYALGFPLITPMLVSDSYKLIKAEFISSHVQVDPIGRHKAQGV